MLKKRINRGVGYGMEIPVEYIFYCNEKAIQCAKKYYMVSIGMSTRIHWMDQRIVRKQLDIMPTYHYMQNQGKLMMQSRKNGQKTQFGQFF